MRVGVASPQDAPLEVAVGSAMPQSERLRKIRSDIQHQLDKLTHRYCCICLLGTLLSAGAIQLCNWIGSQCWNWMGQALVHELHFDWCLKSRCKTKIVFSSYGRGRRKKSEVKAELLNCNYDTADPELSPLQCVWHSHHPAACFTFQCCTKPTLAAWGSCAVHMDWIHCTTHQGSSRLGLKSHTQKPWRMPTGQMIDWACSLPHLAQEAHAEGVWMSTVETEAKIWKRKKPKPKTFHEKQQFL